MNGRWIIPFGVVVGLSLLWFMTEAMAVEPLFDLVFIVAGGLLVVRAGLLRLGRAQPSVWVGHTAFGTGLYGVALVAFGLVPRLETSATVLWVILVLAGSLALLLGALVESRAALRREANPGL